MRVSSLVPSAALSLLGMAVLAAVSVAQPPQNPPEGGQNAPQHGMRRERNFPPPKNLQVLPKDLTGAQVRDIMRHWAGDLGVECTACHAAYADNRTGPNGRPQLDFASDAKDQKKMARIMYTMLELDKKDYVAKVAALDTMGSPAAPLTCGTCHRGHLDPEEYVPPRREEHERRPADAPAGAPPAPQGN